MNVGKTLFAQVMEFVPWKTFGRIIERHKGDAGVRTLGCADLFRVMAFAQITWRESVRDIEACLAANQAKLFHMGLKAPPARSTLAVALNLRDWRICIYHALAQRLIARARTLYAQEPSMLVLRIAILASRNPESGQADPARGAEAVRRAGRCHGGRVEPSSVLSWHVDRFGCCKAIPPQRALEAHNGMPPPRQPRT